MVGLWLGGWWVKWFMVVVFCRKVLVFILYKCIGVKFIGLVMLVFLFI